MKFDIEKRRVPFQAGYAQEEYKLGREFAHKLYKEFGPFIKAIVLFGGQSKGKQKGEGDIDILVIVDNVSFRLLPEIIETYRIVTEKCVAETSMKLHVTTLRFTSFWEYIRIGDPVGINMLRTGIAVLDTGFFYPLQMLLYDGRIRPSPEAVNTYYSRAPATLHNSKWHLLQAALDLYWSVIDSAHAALMHYGDMPPSPGEMAEALEHKFVKTNKMDRTYVLIMDHFYKLSRGILHREIKEIDGKHYDKLYTDAKSFVAEMKRLIGYK